MVAAAPKSSLKTCRPWCLTSGVRGSQCVSGPWAVGGWAHLQPCPLCRPLSRLRRIELDMTDAPDGLAALADTLCTLPALDHATLTFVRSLPERPEVWRSLAQLGSKLRIGWSIDV